jgi:phosphatidylserine synthase
MVIFHEELLKEYAPLWAVHSVASSLPPFAACLGLLMVSRFKYVHMVNSVLRGRRPFRQLVGLAILLLVGFVVQFQLTIAVVAGAYALYAPIKAAVARLHRKSEADRAAGQPSDQPVPTESAGESDRSAG